VQAEDRYDSLIQYNAERERVDWRIIKEQLRAESAFDPDARSKKGALGLAQFMARTWEEWRDGTPGIQPPPVDFVLLDPRDPEDAINAQTSMMAWLLGHFKDLSKALAAYNYGFGNLTKVLNDPECVDRWLECIPKETRDYVNDICGALSK